MSAVQVSLPDDRRPGGQPNDEGSARAGEDPATGEQDHAGPRTSWWLDTGLVAVATVVVFWGLSPAALLSDAFPATGDHLGHVLVPEWLLSTGAAVRGWSDWTFAGFPVNVLYPAVPSVVTTWLAAVLPLTVAYKLVMVLGLLAMPAAAYTAVRLSDLPRAAAPLAAVGVLPFVFDNGSIDSGATLLSTLRGETAHSIGMAAALLALGAVDRVARQGRGVLLAAAAAAVTALAHPVASVWLALGVVGILMARAPWRRPGNLGAVVLAAVPALLVAAWWWLPFLVLRPWMSQLDLPRAADLLPRLFPASALWETVLTGLAVYGAVAAIRRGSRFAMVLAGLTLVSALLFVLLPTGQLQNVRMLPGWYLGRWLFLALGVGEVVRVCLTALPASSRSVASRLAPALVPVTVLVVATGTLAVTRGWVLLDESSPQEAPRSLLGVPVDPVAVGLPGLLRGIEAGEDSDDLADVQAMLAETAQEEGCGRLAWDQVRPSVAPDADPAPFGNDGILVQAAMWTDGCIRSIHGILTDSSTTAADIQIASQLTSESGGYQPLRSVPALQYRFDVGIERLRQLGVRYYLTHGGAPAADAADSEQVRPVAGTGEFELWEIEGWSEVESLRALPVRAGTLVSDSEWRELSTSFQFSQYQGVFLLVQEGPQSWPTTAQLTEQGPPAVDAVEVSDAVIADGRVEFTVSEPGVPVVVRTSAFPGWTAEGADGPYRAAPNFMVVVPTQERVTMERLPSSAERAGEVLGALGLGLLALMALLAVPAVGRAASEIRVLGSLVPPRRPRDGD